jgi:RNA polymerase sigma factor (sigma-70 family)
VADRKLARVLEHVLTASGDDRGVSDAELLERFKVRGDAAAFELLVWRYQRLVLGVCRRVLRDAHEAEDAFQATFLILARRAGSVGRREALGAWLYRVATRAALAARAARSRHAGREHSLGGTAAASPAAQSLAERREVCAVVDEEVSRLPERFRAAVVLCYFEGKTVDEAARQLGWPRGTVASRLARARERLRVRLNRRGLAVTAGTLAAELGRPETAGAAADALARRTGRAVAALSAGRGAGGAALSAKSITLAEEVLRTMSVRKLTTAAAVFVAGLVVLGGGLTLRPYFAARAEPTPAAAAAAPPGAPGEREAPVTVTRPVRREVAPFLDFDGRVVVDDAALRRNQLLVKPEAVPGPEPYNVRFEMDQAAYVRYRRQQRGKGAPGGLAMGLPDESGFPHPAKLIRNDNAVDPNSGTVGIYAALPDADDLLLTGMFVRVRMTFGPPRPVLEVPDGAVRSEGSQAYLWVVGDRDVVERRAVKLGPADDGMRIVEDGLQADDRVVIAGGEALKPGDRVDPREPRPKGKP